MKDNNTLLLVVALAFALAGGILGVVQRAWGVVCVAVAAVILAAIQLF